MGRDRQQERTTLSQVADRAGVSASTVSLVLAGKADRRRISEETRDRVMRAADDLNYAPNLLTRSLRRGRTHILSFFSSFRHRENDDLYMDKISSAIELAGGSLGYDVLVHCNFKRSPREIYQFLNGGLADGVILFAPLPDDPLLQLLQKSSLPVAIVNRRDASGLYPSVSDDEVEGIRLVAENLVARGHRKIAAILQEGGDARDSAGRIALLTQELGKRGLDLPASRVIPHQSDVVSLVRDLMDRPDPSTAVFCWHDRLAYQVLAACETLKVRVPEQLSVVGYDGLHWPSATRHVAASVLVDLNGLATRAVRLVDQLISGYEGPPIVETLPVSFICGTSLGDAPLCNGATE